MREFLDSLRAASVAIMLGFLPGIAASGEAAMSPDQIRELLVGNTVHGIGEESGWFFAIYYQPDGTALGKSGPVEAGTEFWYQQGKWEITSETGYCLTWKTWKRGVMRCMAMIPKGAGYEFRTRDGALQSFVKILPGNADGL